MTVVNELPKAYTEAEAAALLTEHGWHMSSETLRKHRQNGKISSHKIGGLVRYTMQDLVDFIERGKKAAEWQGEKTTKRSNGSRSEGTGSHGPGTRQAGTRHGTTQIADARTAEALMSRI